MLLEQVITTPQRHGQRNGQTTCRSNTALCIASHSKNDINQSDV